MVCSCNESLKHIGLHWQEHEQQFELLLPFTCHCDKAVYSTLHPGFDPSLVQAEYQQTKDSPGDTH